MIQVVRLASFQHAPLIPPFIALPKQSSGEDVSREAQERKTGEVAVAGGGVSVAVTRFPPEQKRPVGPLVVAGVRDGVLWLIDRYPGHYIMVMYEIHPSNHDFFALTGFPDCCIVDNLSWHIKFLLLISGIKIFTLMVQYLPVSCGAIFTCVVYVPLQHKP